MQHSTYPMEILRVHFITVRSGLPPGKRKISTHQPLMRNLRNFRKMIRSQLDDCPILNNLLHLSQHGVIKYRSCPSCNLDPLLWILMGDWRQPWLIWTWLRHIFAFYMKTPFPNSVSLRLTASCHLICLLVLRAATIWSRQAKTYHPHNWSAMVVFSVSSLALCTPICRWRLFCFLQRGIPCIFAKNITLVDTCYSTELPSFIHLVQCDMNSHSQLFCPRVVLFSVTSSIIFPIAV